MTCPLLMQSVFILSVFSLQCVNGKRKKRRKGERRDALHLSFSGVGKNCAAERDQACLKAFQISFICSVASAEMSCMNSVSPRVSAGMLTALLSRNSWGRYSVAAELQLMYCVKTEALALTSGSHMKFRN